MPCLHQSLPTKICVVLDAHPGVTKCFVSVTGDPNPVKNVRRIALYDGTDLTTVVEQDDLGATDDTTGAFFVTGDNAGVRLCDLF